MSDDPPADEEPERRSSDEESEPEAESEPAAEPTETPYEEVGEESPTPEEPAEKAPLEDLARSFEESEGRSASTETDLFEEMDVGEVDSEEIWETVVEEEDEGSGPGAGGPGGVAEEIEPGGPATGTEHVVEKREFCHRCTYFTDPPETACTHEGTEIVEVVDSGHFRVRNCPMVGESERPEFDQG